jgi:acid phosphatase
VEALERRRLFTAGVPQPNHVLIVVEENKSYQDILGEGSIPSILWPVVPPNQSTMAPYIQKLARQGASLVNMHAETNPSQPNYLALFSGSTQGITGDDPPAQPFSAPSLGGELIAAGLSFAGYSEGLPSIGFAGIKSGDYARKHNPWSDFTDVPSSANLPFSAFPTDYSKSPTVSFVVPDQTHDMHSGSARAADHWLKHNLEGYATWARKHNSLLIITWDEGRGGTNHIPTIVYGSGVRKGEFQLGSDHYRLLRTIEAMYNLAPLGAALTSAPLRRIFRPPAIVAMATMPHSPFSQERIIPSAWQRVAGELPATL